MGKLFDRIDENLQSWIEKQKIFFVATAPLSGEGHVNCSPKGLDSFRVLSPNEVAYQDLTGSGIETISHLRENKRIVILFCAFEGPPKILRLYGEGEAVLQGDQRFEKLESLFPNRIGTRAFIHIHLTRITDSCGYGVPLYEFKGDRDTMDKWAAVKGEQGIIDYRQLKNKESIDGLKGLI